MKRVVTVPPAIRLAFIEGLKHESRQAAGLPDPLPMGRVLHVVDLATNSMDQLTVLVGEDENGFYLDYFNVANDGETSWHGRVSQDGSHKSLENYQGQLGKKSYTGDPAKKAAYDKQLLEHNTRVTEILKAKGFK